MSECKYDVVALGDAMVSFSPPGVLRLEQAMQLDRASIFRLIFHPGFTTATTVSEHAGRGSCHFDLPTYAKFAMFMSPLVEQDVYGRYLQVDLLEQREHFVALRIGAKGLRSS